MSWLYLLSRWAFTKVQSLGRRVRQATSPLPWSLYQCCSWPTLCWSVLVSMLKKRLLDSLSGEFRPRSPWVTCVWKKVVPSLLGWLLRHFIYLTGGWDMASLLLFHHMRPILSPRKFVVPWPINRTWFWRTSPHPRIQVEIFLLGFLKFFTFCEVVGQFQGKEYFGAVDLGMVGLFQWRKAV